MIQVTAISLGFDVIVMLLLAATIYYAIKLSRHLDTFRSNRNDMEQLIRELSKQITRAQEGITVLDDLASTKGEELRKHVARAQSLSDELQIITGSADALAERLENLATKNRGIAEQMERNAVGSIFPGQDYKSEPDDTVLRAVKHPKYEDTLSKADKKKNKEDDDKSLFVIRDSDFENRDDDNDKFSSQAERDLAEALKHLGKKK